MKSFLTTIDLAEGFATNLQLSAQLNKTSENLLKIMTLGK